MMLTVRAVAKCILLAIIMVGRSESPNFISTVLDDIAKLNNGMKKNIYTEQLLSGYEGCYNMNAESLQRFVYRHSHLILTHCIMYCWHRRTTFAVTKISGRVCLCKNSIDGMARVENRRCRMCNRRGDNCRRVTSFMVFHTTLHKVRTTTKRTTKVTTESAMPQTDVRTTTKRTTKVTTESAMPQTDVRTTTKRTTKVTTESAMPQTDVRTTTERTTEVSSESAMPEWDERTTTKRTTKVTTEGAMPERDGNLCLTHPCLHNGVCEDIQGDGTVGFRCRCTSGYRGHTCQYKVAHCFHGLCHEGQCIASPSGPVCRCLKGTGGHHCQIDTRSHEKLLIANKRLSMYQAVMAVIASVTVAMVIIITVHCCRVRDRREKRILRYKRVLKMEVDKNLLVTSYPPGVLSTSNELCAEFFCPGRRSGTSEIYSESLVDDILDEFDANNTLPVEDKGEILTRMSRHLKTTNEKKKKTLSKAIRDMTLTGPLARNAKRQDKPKQRSRSSSNELQLQASDKVYDARRSSQLKTHREPEGHKRKANSSSRSYINDVHSPTALLTVNELDDERVNLLNTEPESRDLRVENKQNSVVYEMGQAQYWGICTDVPHDKGGNDKGHLAGDTFHTTDDRQNMSGKRRVSSEKYLSSFEKGGEKISRTSLNIPSDVQHFAVDNKQEYPQASSAKQMTDSELDNEMTMLSQMPGSLLHDEDGMTVDAVDQQNHQPSNYIEQASVHEPDTETTSRMESRLPHDTGDLIAETAGEERHHLPEEQTMYTSRMLITFQPHSTSQSNTGWFTDGAVSEGKRHPNDDVEQTPTHSISGKVVSQLQWNSNRFGQDSVSEQTHDYEEQSSTHVHDSEMTSQMQLNPHDANSEQRHRVPNYPEQQSIHVETTPQLQSNDVNNTDGFMHHTYREETPHGSQQQLILQNHDTDGFTGHSIKETQRNISSDSVSHRRNHGLGTDVTSLLATSVPENPDQFPRESFHRQYQTNSSEEYSVNHRTDTEVTSRIPLTAHNSTEQVSDNYVDHLGYHPGRLVDETVSRRQDKVVFPHDYPNDPNNVQDFPADSVSHGHSTKQTLSDVRDVVITSRIPPDVSGRNGRISAEQNYTGFEEQTTHYNQNKEMTHGSANTSNERDINRDDDEISHRFGKIVQQQNVTIPDVRPSPDTVSSQIPNTSYHVRELDVTSWTPSGVNTSIQPIGGDVFNDQQYSSTALVKPVSSRDFVNMADEHTDRSFQEIRHTFDTYSSHDTISSGHLNAPFACPVHDTSMTSRTPSDFKRTSGIRGDDLTHPEHHSADSAKQTTRHVTPRMLSHRSKETDWISRESANVTEERGIQKYDQNIDQNKRQRTESNPEIRPSHDTMFSVISQTPNTYQVHDIGSSSQTHSEVPNRTHYVCRKSSNDNGHQPAELVEQTTSRVQGSNINTHTQSNMAGGTEYITRDSSNRVDERAIHGPFQVIKPTSDKNKQQQGVTLRDVRSSRSVGLTDYTSPTPNDTLNGTTGHVQDREMAPQIGFDTPDRNSVNMTDGPETQKRYNSIRGSFDNNDQQELVIPLDVRQSRDIVSSKTSTVSHMHDVDMTSQGPSDILERPPRSSYDLLNGHNSTSSVKQTTSYVEGTEMTSHALPNVHGPTEYTIRKSVNMADRRTTQRNHQDVRRVCDTDGQQRTVTLPNVRAPGDAISFQCSKAPVTSHVEMTSRTPSDILERTALCSRKILNVPASSVKQTTRCNVYGGKDGLSRDSKHIIDNRETYGHSTDARCSLNRNEPQPAAPRHEVRPPRDLISPQYSDALATHLSTARTSRQNVCRTEPPSGFSNHGVLDCVSSSARARHAVHQIDRQSSEERAYNSASYTPKGLGGEDRQRRVIAHQTNPDCEAVQSTSRESGTIGKQRVVRLFPEKVERELYARVREQRKHIREEKQARNCARQ